MPDVWAQVDRRGPDECWPWTGSRFAQDGYGQWRESYPVAKATKIGVAFRTEAAHRVVYEQAVGAIPGGHELHHRCGNKACCNPAHLEPVTRREPYQRHRHLGSTLGAPDTRQGPQKPNPPRTRKTAD